MLKNISLRHIVPLLLFSGGLLFVIFFYSISFPATKEQVLALSQQHALSLVQAQQGRIAELLVNKETVPLEKEIYYASTDPGTHRILILNEDNVAEYANRSRLVGMHVSETGLYIEETILDNMSTNSKIIIDRPAPEHPFLTGYAPLNFTRDNKDFRWRLVIMRDYRSFTKTVLNIAAYPSEMLATFMLVTSILAIVVLRKHLEARIYPLLNAAARLSRGEKKVRANLNGMDEFAEIGTSFDQMAERVEANTIELENAKQNAEKANAAKNHFLSHMSHEIQTPLTGLMGFIDLMKENELDSHSSLYLRSMESATRTLSDLIGDLLETSRLEAGTITPRPTAFCLNSVLQDMLDALLPQAQKKGISIKIICSDSNPIWIKSDARIFRQILLNLLGNAIQYTNTGTVSIIVASATNEHNEIDLSISIVDTGIGISQSDLPYIFERFYRSNDIRVSKQKGAGIGLTICNDFAALLHGTIDVKSTLDTGSTFLFDVTVPPAKPEEEFDFVSLTVREQESLQILLVENADITQALFVSILEKSGHVVEACSNAATAIQIMKDRLIYPHLEPISLVLMDLHLPITDGFQAAAAIRGLDSRYIKLPIIATSTQDDQMTRERCLSGVFDGFIPKPINRRHLTEEVFRLTRLTEAKNAAKSIDLTPITQE